MQHNLSAKVVNLTLVNSSNDEPPTPVCSTPKNKPLKIKARDVIVYPEFIEASKEITDPFWVNILQDMASAKYLPSFTIRDNKLYYRFRNTTEYINLHLSNKDNINYLELANSTIDFIREQGKIYSPWDHAQLLNDIEDIANIDSRRNYNSLASTNYRKQILYIYANDLIKNMKLDPYYINQLYELLYLSYLTGIINKNNLTIDNGFITKVDNIYWNPQLQQFCINSELIDQALHKKTKHEYLITMNNKYNAGVNIDAYWGKIVQTII